MIYDPRMKGSKKGKRDQMALNIDIAPTIIELASEEIPDEMQGMSLLPLMESPEAKGRKDWYYEHDVKTRSKGKDLPQCEGVRTDRWKYTRYKDTDPLQEELFDLQNDPNEINNLVAYSEHKETLNKLRKRCDELKESLKE